MKYQDWEILTTMPNGWKIDKTCGSPLHDAVFITNGKSVLNGQKRALLRLEKQIIKQPSYEIERKEQEKVDFNFYPKSVNTLARKKFQEKLMKEILVDLMVCEIEGWSKREYILELKRLINSIKTTGKKQTAEPKLF